MKSIPKTQIAIPVIGLIAGTRVLLGGGIGLLLADRLRDEQRRAVGWTLLAVGAASTVPLAIQVVRGRRALKARTDDERAGFSTEATH